MAALPVALSERRMSEQAYLRMDCEIASDFVDGFLEERHLGEYSHNKWQDALQAWFREHYPAWRLRACPEWRTKVSSTRYRIPDVAVTSMDQPIEEVLITPPVAVFEVLSPEDTLRRMVIKLQDYERMGIRNIFVIDPEGPAFFRFEDGKLGPAEEKPQLAGTGGSLDWEAIQQLFY